MLWGFPGAAAIGASASYREQRKKISAAADSSSDAAAAAEERQDSPEELAAGVTARALDLLRHIMDRSSTMQADLSDDRVMAAWIQGLSEAAQAVVQETGLGHLPPSRR